MGRLDPKLIWDGMTRIVLLIGPFAIKIPKPGNEEDGRNANRRERHVYRKTKDRRLCPVIWADPEGNILVMQRVDYDYPYTKTDYIDPIYYRNKFKNFLEFANDMHPGNFGYIGKRLVMVDYGTIIKEAKHVAAHQDELPPGKGSREHGVGGLEVGVGKSDERAGGEILRREDLRPNLLCEGELQHDPNAALAALPSQMAS